MAGFGDDELEVGVGDVPGEMLAEARVVEPGDRHAREPGAAEREDIVRRVVEQHADVRRTGRVEAGPIERGEALRLGQEFRVRPDPVAEAESGTVAVMLDVASQQGRDVSCREGDLGEWRRKGCRRASGPAGIVRHGHVPLTGTGQLA